MAHYFTHYGKPLLFIGGSGNRNNTANPEFVAADLLSQAEHGPDSQVILVVSDEAIVNDVQTALQKHLIADRL